MSIGVLINHAISFLTAPLSVTLAALIAGLVLLRTGRRVGWLLAVGGAVTLYALSTGLAYGLLGVRLERLYPPQDLTRVPNADAILVLGGGVAMNTNALFQVECAMSADRVFQAYRLYRANRARSVFVTSEADRLALVELGVSPGDIRPPSRAGNTEEEIRHVAACFRGHPRILLVTSAWHMRRAMLMCARYGRALDVVPVATDYEALLNEDGRFHLDSLLPSAEALFRTSCMLKEYVGYWGYRLLRK